MTPQVIFGLRKNEFEFKNTSLNKDSQMLDSDESSFILFDQIVYGLGVPFEFNIGKIYTSIELRKYLQEALIIKYVAEDATLNPFLQVNITVGLKM
jgi:hypothetical protein